MHTDDKIVNRVADSGLILINLEDYIPSGEIILFDIKQALWKDQILKEKHFREFLSVHNWEEYKKKHVVVSCSIDAIIPTWAYMLTFLCLTPYAENILFGSIDEMRLFLFRKKIAEIDYSKYKDKRILIKGCGSSPVPISAFTELTKLLMPFAKSIMYGEACSTVPLYKSKD